MTLLSRLSIAFLAPAIVVAASPPPVSAQTAGTTPPGEWVLHSSLGAGSAGGGYGDFLEKPVTFDLNLGKGRGPCGSAACSSAR
jgi:hypothetical protein